MPFLVFVPFFFSSISWLVCVYVCVDVGLMQVMVGGYDCGCGWLFTLHMLPLLDVVLAGADDCL